ncbi:tyrosine-protein phosphatase [Stella sp.]|uniref:fused DSP-PTPase phosphatase/NAD kinase-like protein n=1 Tax=Stella sp. TaxID=2912054 RepID=UPI0035B443D7
MMKRWTRAAGDRLKRRRGTMATPWQRALARFELLFMDHAVFRHIKLNLHPVSPRMWRSAQPSPGHLARIAALGVKTVINLRGARDCAAYLLEQEACRRLGMTLVDFPLTSREPPSPERVAAFDRMLREIEYPALMHCKSGADRAGIGAALYLMLQEGRPLAEAQAQLHWKFGHLRHSRTGVLDFMLERYGQVLRREGVGFRDWVRRGYDPLALRAEFQAGRFSSALVDRILRRE